MKKFIYKNTSSTYISELPEYVVSSEDISYYNRIAMQSAFQDYIDASISSTINLPNSATVENVKNIYFYAWECGLKGVTIFKLSLYILIAV